MPTDVSPDAVISGFGKLKNLGITVVSCFITDKNLVSTRHLYGAPKTDWPDGAKLMFECASLLKPNSPFDTHLTEHGWIKEAGSRLFSQVNHTDLLKEFAEIVLSPLRETQEEKQMLDAKNRLFISYSHHDAKWLERLQVHLKPIVREGSIDVWSDLRIRPGSQWRNEVNDALDAANIAILLVSADFMNSDFIAEVELPKLLSTAKS